MDLHIILLIFKHIKRYRYGLSLANFVNDVTHSNIEITREEEVTMAGKSKYIAASKRVSVKGRISPKLAEGAHKGLRLNIGKVAKGRVGRIGKAAGVMSVDCTKSGECAKKCS